MTFSEFNKMSFNGNDELSTECDNVKAMDFDVYLLLDLCFFVVGDVVSSSSRCFMSSTSVNLLYKWYEIAISDDAITAATQPLGLLRLLDINLNLVESKFVFPSPKCVTCETGG